MPETNYYSLAGTLTRNGVPITDRDETIEARAPLDESPRQGLWL